MEAFVKVNLISGTVDYGEESWGISRIRPCPKRAAELAQAVLADYVRKTTDLPVKKEL